MDARRIGSLKKNSRYIFWVQALLNVHIIQVVLTLFFISRGLTLAQVMFTGIVWAIINLLFEIPSSYMADVWGRKKTIVIGTLFYLLVPLFWFFAHGPALVMLGFVFYALSFACFSGSDEALVYDTAKELGEEGESLEHLSKYFSAKFVLKIFGPLIAVFIAKDLTENQYLILLAIDFALAFIALSFALRIVEPKHHMDLDVSKSEFVQEAWRVVRKERDFITSIINSTLIFTGSFIIWRYDQKLFLDLGVPIIIFGLSLSLVQIALFLFNRRIRAFFPERSVAERLQILNISFTGTLIAFVAVWYLGRQELVLLALYCVAVIIEAARWSFLSEYFNKKSKSYNRATTLSLTNLLKNLIMIPLILFGAFLVSQSMIYPYIFVAAVSLFTTVFLRFDKKKKDAVSQV
jgi:MFS family permease